MSPAVVAGLALLVLYWAWIGLFFARVRPSIMAAVGRRLQVDVEESAGLLDAGTYDVRGDDAPLRKTGVVLLADFVVLMVGTVGVAALLFVPAFIVADSGALLPLESKLTGRAATLATLAGATTLDASGSARLDVDAANGGRAALRDCVAGVDGYTARNGYLHGRSATFALASGERRRVAVELEAMRPVPGDHPLRIKLECANERLAVAQAVVRVR